MAPIPELTLGPGMTITLEALDPATSLAVAGVTVSHVAIVGVASAERVTEVRMRDLMRPAPPRHPPASSGLHGGAPAAASTAPLGAHRPR